MTQKEKAKLVPVSREPALLTERDANKSPVLECTLSSYSRLKIADSSLIRFSAVSSSFFLAAFLRLPPSSFCSTSSFINRASCFAA